MNKIIAVALLTLAVTAQNRRMNTYFVEIPFVMQGRFHTHYLRVSGVSREDAIKGIGITVFTEKEWLQVCKSPYCEIPPTFDCGQERVK